MAWRRCRLPASRCIATNTPLCRWLQHSGRVWSGLPWEERTDPGQAVPCCPGRALLPGPPVVLRFPVSSHAMRQPPKNRRLSCKTSRAFPAGRRARAVSTPTASRKRDVFFSSAGES